MRIDNYLLNNVFVGLAAETSAADEAGQRASADRVSPDANLQLSAQLSEWISLVQQDPEIRAEAVHQAVQKLAAGAYLTPQSAVQTAEAMLNP